MIDDLREEIQKQEKRVSLLAGIPYIVFFIAGFWTLGLLVRVWNLETVFSAITVGLWAIGLIIKLIVDEKKSRLKELIKKLKDENS